MGAGYLAKGRFNAARAVTATYGPGQVEASALAAAQATESLPHEPS